MLTKTKSVISTVLTLFALIQATIGWARLVKDWARYAKNRGY